MSGYEREPNGLFNIEGAAERYRQEAPHRLDDTMEDIARSAVALELISTDTFGVSEAQQIDLAKQVIDEIQASDDMPS